MVPRPFWGGVFFGSFGTPVTIVKYYCKGIVVDLEQLDRIVFGR